MKQNDINIKLAEKTEQISDNLDSFKKEAGEAICSMASIMSIMNNMIDCERRMQHRTNIAHAVAIILTNIALILALLKGVI